jgi:hypothetical protein
MCSDITNFGKAEVIIPVYSRIPIARTSSRCNDTIVDATELYAENAEVIILTRSTSSPSGYIINTAGRI